MYHAYGGWRIVRLNSLLSLIPICGLAACSQFGTIGNIDGAPPLVIDRVQINDAIGKIYPEGLPDAARRNEIIGEYMSESDQLCSAYLQSLTRYQRTNNLIFGTLSTTLGALGAAFTQASVVRPLSAAAAIASGERAEIDADSFARQTAEVIASAIKNSRLRTYDEIVAVKFPKSITAWPINLAIADVINYHEKCSLHEGLAEASASISATAPAPILAVSGVDTSNIPAGRISGPKDTVAQAVANATAAAVAGADAAVRQGTSPSAGAALGAAAGATATNPATAAKAGTAAVTGSTATVQGPPPAPGIRGGRAALPSGELSRDEMVKLRQVFGLTPTNATSSNSPAFRDKVRQFQQCLPEKPTVTGFLTIEQKGLALAGKDPCLPIKAPPGTAPSSTAPPGSTPDGNPSPQPPRER